MFRESVVIACDPGGLRELLFHPVHRIKSSRRVPESPR